MSTDSCRLPLEGSLFRASAELILLIDGDARFGSAYSTLGSGSTRRDAPVTGPSRHNQEQEAA